MTGGFVQNPRKPEDIAAEIASTKAQRVESFGRLRTITPDHKLLLVREGEWIVRGLHYHLEAILGLQGPSIQSIADMAASDTSNLLVAHAPALVDLTYEFGALSALARIAVNQVLRFCQPSLNLAAGSLPNSITKVLGWDTDHPVLRGLQTDLRAVIDYLIDLRDCLTHHRTLAVGDELLAVEEGFPENRIPEMQPFLVLGMVRVYFRRLGGTAVSVNISLPDQIYVSTGTTTKLIRPFTYQTINLVSQARDFVRICSETILVALTLNLDDKKYNLAPKPRAQPP